MLQNVHPAFAAEFSAEAARLRDKYTAPLHLSVDVPPPGASPEIVDAFAWTINKGNYPVTLNTYKFGPYANPAKTRLELAEMAKDNRSVELSVPDVLTHEYGHVLTDYLPMHKWYAFAKELQHYLRANSWSDRQLASALSLYALSSATEATAEAFVLMDRGADHPAAYIAEKYLGKFRK